MLQHHVAGRNMHTLIPVTCTMTECSHAHVSMSPLVGLNANVVVQKDDIRTALPEHS